MTATPALSARNNFAVGWPMPVVSPVISAVALANPLLIGGCLIVTGIADYGTSNLPPLFEAELRTALT